MTPTAINRIPSNTDVFTTIVLPQRKIPLFYPIVPAGNALSFTHVTNVRPRGAVLQPPAALSKLET